MKIKFTTQQIEYLKANLDETLSDIKDKFRNNKSITESINLNLDDAYQIREWAGSKLQQFGFDKNYRLTTEGEILENLIDLLYF